MSTPTLAEQLRASATRLREMARDGTTPAALSAHALTLGMLAVQAARMEDLLDEMVDDAMKDEQATHQHQRHQRIIDGLLTTPACHLAQRRPGQC